MSAVMEAPTVDTTLPLQGRTIECLRFSPESRRSQVLLEAMMGAAETLGALVRPTERYRGQSDWLLLWGPGAPDRFEPMAQQLRLGGHSLVFDLAYWDRDRKVRVSIDRPHPQDWVMRKDWPRTRLERDRIVPEDAWNWQGPIIVAGIGPKALQQYGGAVDTWERGMIRYCRDHWPNRPLLYKPKKAVNEPPAGVKRTDRPIDELLRGASLLITWHSNAAVDAIRLGIPVLCRDGAAAAVCHASCPNHLEFPLPLEPTVRDRFLSNLAWFQWAPTEAAACWRFLAEVVA